METKQPDPREHMCIRCEPRGIERRADTFVKMDGLLNQDQHPMCKPCAKEWKKEFTKLTLNQPLFGV